MAGALKETDAAAWTKLFGELTGGARDDIARRVAWVRLEGGSRLMQQGEIGDSAYIVVSGRLQAVVHGEDGGETVIGEIARGESVGEMALITGEPRVASIYAVRDSLLARLSRDDFQELILSHPELLLNLSRLIIRRSRQNGEDREAPPRIRNVAVIFHDEAARNSGFLSRLGRSLDPHGSTLLLHSSLLEEVPEGPPLDAWLDERERNHRFILYCSDDSPTDWTRRCLRQADRVLLVASFPEDASPRRIERELFTTEEAVGRAGLELVLLHRDGSRPPVDTRRWLGPRRALRHHHVRMDRDADLQRLGRFLAGEAVSIVLAGGGAKGFAHLGVVRALREAGFPLDLAGGTSIGAITAAAIAHDWDPETFVENHRKAFTGKNPLNDYNALPMVSLMRGARMERLLRKYLGTGDIEDLWLPFFCVSSNMSQSRKAVHTGGTLWKAVRASLSLPGVLPPVVYGNDLHIDGGSFDNLPVETARKMGAGRIIASNLQFSKKYELSYDVVPTTWQLFRDRYVTRRRRYKVPGMVNTLFRATVLSSFERGRQAGASADLYLESPMQKVGLMNWAAFDRGRKAGYEHTRERLREEGLEPGRWIPGNGGPS